MDVVRSYSGVNVQSDLVISISDNSNSAKRLSEQKIHFDCFFQPYFGVGYFFASPNYPKCKFELVKNSPINIEIRLNYKKHSAVKRLLHKKCYVHNFTCIHFNNHDFIYS